jgi:hypothetical protein
MVSFKIPLPVLRWTLALICPWFYRKHLENEISSLIISLTFRRGFLFLEIVIKWKRTSWSCYQIEPYKMESSTSGKDCKEHCGKESQCLMAQFLKPFCYLSLVQSYDAFPCSKTSVLYMKGNVSENQKLQFFYAFYSLRGRFPTLIVLFL